MVGANHSVPIPITKPLESNRPETERLGPNYAILKYDVTIININVNFSRTNAISYIIMSILFSPKIDFTITVLNALKYAWIANDDQYYFDLQVDNSVGRY